MRIALVYLSVFSLLFLACERFGPETEKGAPVARVHEKYLYADELAERIPNDLSAQDSSELAKRIVRNWIEKELLVFQAETNLKTELEDVERKLEEYRNDLIIFAYQRELIKQKLDTNITDEAIEAYYRENPDNFKLKDYIVKVRYVRLDTNAPKTDDVRTWMSNPTEKNRALLEEYCYQFAANFYLDDNNWLYLDDVLREIPIEVYNKEQFVRSRRLITHNDSLSIYYLRISDYQLKDDISPLALEKNKIKTMLLNQRKREFLNKLKKDLFIEAERKNNFETFDRP